MNHKSTKEENLEALPKATQEHLRLFYENDNLDEAIRIYQEGLHVEQKVRHDVIQILLLHYPVSDRYTNNGENAPMHYRRTKRHWTFKGRYYTRQI